MRTRFTLVVSMTATILGGILLHYEEARPAYAQSPFISPNVNARPNNQALPVITITKMGALYLNDQPVNINVLVDDLERNFPTASDVYVRPDMNTIWAPVAQVLSALNAAKPPIQAKFVLPESPK